MTEIGESITVDTLGKVLAEKCPFLAETAEKLSEEKEDGNDDTDKSKKKGGDTISEPDESKGGTLGRNLIRGSQGKKGTVGGGYCLEPATPEPRVDTRRTKGREMLEFKYKGKEEKFPYTVAAHHLIPGNASLAKSTLYENFMTKGGSIESQSGKVWKIKEFIGYNVNGAHNGVWLPGSYAIRTGSSPFDYTWSVVVENYFKNSKDSKDPKDSRGPFDYVIAAMKKVGGQFHDTHTVYSEHVQKTLEKYSVKLYVHMDSCEECAASAGPDKKISPPYVLKDTLYSLSAELRAKVTGPAASWNRIFFTSDQWRDEIMKHIDAKGTL